MMNGNKLSTRDYQLFLYKTFIFLSLTWAGFAMALAGYFYASIVWGFGITLAILMIYLAKKHRVVFKISREMFIVSLISFAIALAFAFLSSPTVFSGRDQGAISEAAIRLSQNHSFYFSTPASEEFFKLHEKGRALNFPGFYYTENGSLITQFPLVYSVWLALFFSILGLKGFALANAIALSFFLVSFYLILRLFLELKASIVSILLTTSSFMFMWFSKFTLTENLALPLVWISILSLLLFIEHQRKLYYIVMLSSLFLLSFTRIEGWAFVVTFLIATLCHPDTRKYLKEKLFHRLFLPLAFFASFSVINFLVDINFYREMAKAMIPSVKLPQAQYLGNLKNTALPDFYALKIFALYGMIGFFIIGLFAVSFYIYKKQFYKLIPFFVALPTLIYLFDSNISPDHPWMLRRYMISILPLAMLYSGMLIGEWFESKNIYSKQLKYSAVFLAAILFFQNIPAFSYFLTYKDNENLLQQTNQLSQRFSEKDLILIDQKTTSDGWSMVAGPMSSLYGKNAVYFFNTQDLSKLDLKPFENIYLISSNEQVPYYLSSTIGKKLIQDSTYSFNFKKLDIKRAQHLDKVDFPAKQDVKIEGKVFKINKN